VGRKRLFNTSGQSYRALGSAAVAAMDDEQALAALAADGKLIRRPFAITGRRCRAGGLQAWRSGSRRRCAG
jgi:arsenate reductase